MSTSGKISRESSRKKSWKNLYKVTRKFGGGLGNGCREKREERGEKGDM